MSPATKAKAPKEKLTLRDGVDLYQALDRYIEDHIDEIELNGGALPDDLAQVLDEVDAATADRVDAIAAKLDELSGHASAAKATKDRAARREKVWNNSIAGLKAYALYQVQRSGGDRLHGLVAVLRIQNNSAPSTDLMAPADAQQDLLIGLYDTEQGRLGRLRKAEDIGALLGIAPGLTGVPIGKQDPLAQYITVQRVATLDKKALGAAYMARLAELEREAELIGEPDIPWVDGIRPDDVTIEQIETALADIRTRYVVDSLASEFPGVRCVRGQHLRID